ncbi:hypothetical protein ACF0H5_017578 [Mactra antiquata]
MIASLEAKATRTGHLSMSLNRYSVNKTSTLTRYKAPVFIILPKDVGIRNHKKYPDFVEGKNSVRKSWPDKNVKLFGPKQKLYDMVMKYSNLLVSPSKGKASIVYCFVCLFGSFYFSFFIGSNAVATHCIGHIMGVSQPTHPSWKS